MEDITVSSAGAGRGAALHHLPCRIAHDGPAKVSTYFVPEAAPEGGE
jgi:hypothetical protein